MIRTSFVILRAKLTRRVILSEAKDLAEREMLRFAQHDKIFLPAALAVLAMTAALAFAEDLSTGTASMEPELPPPAPQVRLVYPREGAKMPYLKQSFVLGNVKPSSASVTINGSTVSVYRTGSFAAMIPFSTGIFTIAARAELDGLSTETLRTVFVAQPSEVVSTAPLTILEETISPSVDVKIPRGERITVRFRGSPSASAEFRVKAGGDDSWQPMAERPASSGNYEGSYLASGDTDREPVPIEFRLTQDKQKDARSESPGKIKAADPLKYSVVEVSTAEAVLRTGPSLGADTMGYELFLPRGARLRAQGYFGSEVRLKLTDSEILWGDEKALRQLPAGAPLPSTILDGVRNQNKERSLLLTFDLKERVPCKIIPSEDLKSFRIRLYYTISNLDRIRYDTQEGPRWLKDVRWSQAEREVTEVQLGLNEKIWGYDFRYEGSKLICEVFFAPFSKRIRNSLQGLTLAVDPGHSLIAGDGAISPQGYLEGEVNYAVSECLKKKLEKLGAQVFMTRERGEYVSLADRGKRAIEAGSNLFISVHANAVPDGVNPASRGGYSVFYFHPMSLELARSVHGQYPKYATISDDGLSYGNLAVCRIPEMPSILVEAAYLIRPDEEELLLDPRFQCQCAEGITQGVLEFLRSY